MNFKEFYQKTEKRLTDAILSLWATGDKEMQDYFKFLLKKDPVLAETVFQATFPWEPASITFDKTNNTFKPEFVDALDKIVDKEFQFPKNRYPYKHQLKSWKVLINDRKSIAVTTGTGSGKTECFMLPVLHDIYENCRNQEGVNAIFLYPLNALIASQRKRMHAWCTALSGIRYALLTGDTENKVNFNDSEGAFPQLISREQIRNSPPQILFTNPTMLEYMLVRNADVPIIEKSKGKLRWILLDEAHTLSGSSAAEMALLIRRVIAAFEVDIKDLRFAITSATVGDGDEEKLKRFMSNLCGINTKNIEVIHGVRINNQIKDKEIPSLSPNLSANKVIKIRSKFLKSKGLSQKEIGEVLDITDTLKQLEVIDILADQKINGHNLLPVRGHFFVRGIGGVYVCTNPKCEIHGTNKPEKAQGTMYTIADKKCSCGHPLLELIACRTCGNMMLEGETYISGNNKKVKQIASEGYEAFQIENDNEEQSDEKNINHLKKNLVRFVKNNGNSRFMNEKLVLQSISTENEIVFGDNYFVEENNRCPYCNSTNENPIHFRISSAFTNRILSDIILDQTQDAENITTKSLNRGKKYISFTDSRQGTAKIAALINIDSESNWFRYQTYHYLLDKYKSNQSIADIEELHQKRTYFSEQLKTAPVFAKKDIEDRIIDINNQIEGSDKNNLSSSRTKWNEIVNFIKEKNEFRTLFLKVGRGQNLVQQNEIYANSLLYDQFSRRIPRERSMENLGLINLVYPFLDNVSYPDIADRLNIKEDEWKDLVKISLDYVIRYGFHFSFQDTLRTFSTKFYRPQLIYPQNSDEINAKEWPQFNPKSSTQSRLVLLICAGLGWHNQNDIDRESECMINDLLTEIWKVLKTVLTRDENGFKLNFFEKTNLELAGIEYLCPVTNRLIDKHFRGYSPWIKGNLNSENIRNFYLNLKNNYHFNQFDYPFHLNDSNDKIDQLTVQTWLENNSIEARQKGIWNDLHERIFNFNNLYLAGEHSAQQNKKRLEELEAQFENGEINILSCSTTMEMGVDIGGISAVVMSNVPPMPANYLQRTGRAGRRSENKSLALTFCAPNPIGLRTMKNPMWALEHKIASPVLIFDSITIVKRHLNSLLFGIFIRQKENDSKGLNVKENIQGFFLRDNNTIAENFLAWLDNIDVSKLKNVLNQITRETPLAKTNKDQLVFMVNDNFKKVVKNIKAQNKALEKKLVDLETEFGENSPAYKAVVYRKHQFLNKFVLNYLAEVGFLPNSGLPTGIIEFEKFTISDLLKNKNSSHTKDNPSYTISRALTEFAPGNNILIDGINFKSSGIILNSTWGQMMERTAIQGCKNCGFQRTIPLNSDTVQNKCPNCEAQNIFTGIELDNNKGSFTEVIEPAGFAVDLFADTTRVISEKSKPQYLEPLLLNLKPWKSEQINAMDFRVNNDDNTEILFYNKGEGDGYSLCLDCGRVESNNDQLKPHRRLRGGKDNNGESHCSAKNIKDNIILGSKFKTDFTEVRFQTSEGSLVNDKTLVYSLGVILTKTLAEYLAIDEGELGFGIKKYKGYQTVFIYDTAKGGAGYASQFSFYSDEIVKTAFQILKNCDCQTACTKCLIDRSTQWHIQNLDRQIALNWLVYALNIAVPAELQAPKIKIVNFFGNLRNQIKSLHYHYGIKQLFLHINSNIHNWNLDEIQWLETLKRDGIDINIIIEGDISYSSNNDKFTIHLLSKSFHLSSGVKTKILNYPVHLSVSLHDNHNFSYISKNEYCYLDGQWQELNEANTYKVVDSSIPDYESFILPNFQNCNLFESRLSSIPYGTKSNELAGLVLNNVNNSQGLIDSLNGNTFEISYFDKYNQSKFSLLMLLQFLNQFKTICCFHIKTFKVYLSRKDFRNYDNPFYIIHNYISIDDYKCDLEDLERNFNFKVQIEEVSTLPHYRYFELKSNNITINIRIDGGIAHGLKPIDYLESKKLLSTNNYIFEIRKDVYYDLIYNFNIES